MNNNEIVSSEVVDFERYCEAIGITPEDFHNLELNIEKVIYGAQKATSLLFFKSAAIANKKLDNCLSDEGIYPREEIKGLRTVYEMFSRVTGVQSIIDVNTAIKVLEASGYSISKDFIEVGESDRQDRTGV